MQPQTLSLLLAAIVADACNLLRPNDRVRDCHWYIVVRGHPSIDLITSHPRTPIGSNLTQTRRKGPRRGRCRNLRQCRPSRRKRHGLSSYGRSPARRGPYGDRGSQEERVCRCIRKGPAKLKLAGPSCSAHTTCGPAVHECRSTDLCNLGPSSFLLPKSICTYDTKVYSFLYVAH